jgi:HEAT repeat protein
MSLLQQELGPEAAAPMLQQCLRSDADSGVRLLAAQLLGQEHAQGNVEALLQAFQKDELDVRIYCAAALSSLGQPGPASQLIPHFVGMLDSPDGAVRRDAVESLNRLSCPQVLPLLTRALRDTNGDVRAEALNGLWDFMETAPIASLVEPLLNDPVASVRNAAKEILDQAQKKKE